MSNREGGYRRNKRNDHTKDKIKGQFGEKGKEIFKNMDETNPIIQAFQGYSVELDAKHDRYERLVKISRDITIESKRIIFLLHNIDNESKRDSIFQEAEKRLTSVIDTPFKCIALELENQDPYQYLRAYSPGLQEFIEALTFYQYLKEKTLHGCEEIQNNLTYNLKSDKTLKTILPPQEYILGVADLTGELMRKCINNLGSGNIEDCFSICNFVKQIYTGFLLIGNTANGRDMRSKAYVLKQSLQKMENVCYNIVVRGSEIPKHMLSSIISPINSNDTFCEDDEGYY